MAVANINDLVVAYDQDNGNYIKLLTGRSCWRLLHCPLLPRLCASPTIQGGQIWNLHVIVISILIVITLDIKGSHILLLPAFNQFALQKLLLLR